MAQCIQTQNLKKKSPERYWLTKPTLQYITVTLAGPTGKIYFTISDQTLS